MSSYKLATKEYQLSICDHILDNSYGHIGVTLVERKIERLPIFKRLHSISQLGLVNWIFPCALHTRYTHSIGVMHIAGQMAEHINANKGCSFFSDGEIQIIRLAGMLHDIGHYPLSHNVEYVYRDIQKNQPRQIAQATVNKKLKHYVNCPDFLNPSDEIESKSAADLLSDYTNDYNGSTKFHHEAIGQSLITHNKDIFKVVRDYFVLMPPDTNTGTADPPVLNPLFKQGNKKTYSSKDVDKITKALLEMIGYIIIGKYSFNSKYTWGSKFSAMVQLMHSELDADNMDYLLRDASFSGTSYGIMDMSVLMNCLTVSEFTLKNSATPSRVKCQYIVGVKPKGIGCVEQFLLNKYLAYSQMTYSKYVSILEAMLTQIASEWINIDDVYRPNLLQEMVNLEETDDRYLRFTDSIIVNKIFELSSSGPMLSNLPRHIVSHLKNYSAFNLSHNSENECICASISEKQILSQMQQNPVYDRFCKKCGEFGKKTGEEYRHLGKEKELFSYRFETYFLTKQLPKKVFCNKYDIDNVTLAESKFNYHYFRLGNGIPVIKDGESYYLTADDNATCLEHLPDLTVDCPQSVLHDIYALQYVSLREYAVEDFSLSI